MAQQTPWVNVKVKTLLSKCMQNTNGRTESTLAFIKLWGTGMFYFLCDICCFTKVCDVAKLRVCAEKKQQLRLDCGNRLVLLPWLDACCYKHNTCSTD